MKRFISAFLSLVMAISLLAYLPIQAYAVDITDHVFTYPVTKSHKRLSRGYSTANEHFALDISPSPDSASKTKNVEVMAACDGEVIKVYTGCNNWSGGSKNGVNCKNAGICSPSDGYGSGFCNIGLGNGVIIYHPSTKTYSAYGHMMKDSITVKAGDKVVAGQLIGYMGSCGWSTGKHLHFEIVYSTASSPSLSDYKYNRFTTKNCVNTNPYGDISVGSSASRDPDNIYYNFLDAPSVGGPNNSKVTIEPYSNKTAGTTGDKWLYPAFKVTVPNYRNSGITTVGYTVYTVNGTEMFRFEETYRSGVNQDGTSYKNTFFGARTDGAANMDLAEDIYDVSREYLTDARFIPGHSYKVKGFVVFDGKRYESSEYGFATTGTKQCSWGSGKVTKQPTCTATGVKTYTCLTCGGTKTESIDPKGHTPGAAATCTSPQKCTVCGTQLVAALGHNYSGSYWYSAHPHEEYQKCTRCSAEKKTGNTKKAEGCSICYPTVTFTITYNANGGSGAPASQIKTSGKALTLSSTKPTRQGYTFLGWATSSGASSAQYNPGSSFTTDANTTLYAVWRKDAVSTGAQIVVGNVTGRSGSIISVPISIKNNPGIYAIRFEMDIDTNVFEFVEFDCTSSVFPIDSYSGLDSATKKFKLNRSGNSVENNVVADGLVTIIKLKIKDNVPDGTYNLIACIDAANTINLNGLVKVSDGVGSVSISNYLLGDANGDGQITNSDLLIMKRYIFNKITYPLPCSMNVVDINGDNECTNADILRVCRYIFNKDKYPLN